MLLAALKKHAAITDTLGNALLYTALAAPVTVGVVGGAALHYVTAPNDSDKELAEKRIYLANLRRATASLRQKMLTQQQQLGSRQQTADAVTAGSFDQYLGRQ